MNSFIQYLKDVRGELTHVSWPTRRDAIAYTILVVVISFITAAYVGVFDYLFSHVLGFIIRG